MNEGYHLLRERRIHGDASFPFAVYEVETNKSMCERVGCHWHEEMEFLVITDGRAQVMVNGHSYQAESGNIFVIPPDCLHALNGRMGECCSFFAVDFSVAYLSGAKDDMIQKHYIDSLVNGEVSFPVCLLGQGWEEEATRQLLRLRELFRKKEPAFELLVKAELFRLWHLLYTHAGSGERQCSGTADYRARTVRSVIEYIKMHYDSAVSLEQLAGEFGISRGHLCRMFKDITNMTTVEYMNYYRISVSASWLKETDRDIGEIAGMAGFGNISYFNRVFRNYMHMTPSEYRKKILAAGTDSSYNTMIING